MSDIIQLTQYIQISAPKTLDEIALIIGAILGVFTFVWQVISWVYNYYKGKPVDQANIYESLSTSIEKLNNTVKTQGEIVDDLVSDIKARDSTIEEINSRLKLVTEKLDIVTKERDELLSRIILLEKEFTIRTEEYQRLLHRLRIVEKERDDLKLSLDHAEIEISKLKKAFGGTKL